MTRWTRQRGFYNQWTVDMEPPAAALICRQDSGQAAEGVFGLQGKTAEDTLLRHWLQVDQANARSILAETLPRCHSLLPRSLRAALWGALLVLLAGLLPAQFEVVPGGPGVAESRLEAVRELMERGLGRLGSHFPGTPSDQIRVVVHRDESTLSEALRESLHPGVPGFARLQLHEIHLVLEAIRSEPPNDLRTTVEHELVHILLDQYVGPRGLSVPRWFHEGLAQYLCGTAFLGVTEEDLVFRLINRTHLRFSSLREDFPKDDENGLRLAYGQSFSFVSYLQREIGLEPLLQAARNCSPEKTFPYALAEITNVGLVTYEDQWIAYVTHGSGAGYRVILRNCFLFLMAGIVPLLALALARRVNRDHAFRKKLAEAEDEAEDGAEAEEAEEAEQEEEYYDEEEDGDQDPENW